jgi:hypothetical protein
MGGQSLPRFAQRNFQDGTESPSPLHYNLSDIPILPSLELPFVLAQCNCSYVGGKLPRGTLLAYNPAKSNSFLAVVSMYFLLAEREENSLF